MRTLKHADQRKNEILNIADTLFAQKGFDGTSTNDILERAGIARGTLYYHFKSKEEIMDALIQRYSQRLLSAAGDIAADHSRPVYERILRSVMALKADHSGREIIEHIHKPQNALMQQKVQAAILNGLPPILAGIIREGIDQGLFHTPYPYEAMEMLIAYTSTLLDSGLVELTEQERASRIQALLFHTERLLGVEEGTFSFAAHLFTAGEEPQL